MPRKSVGCSNGTSVNGSFFSFPSLTTPFQLLQLEVSAEEINDDIIPPWREQQIQRNSAHALEMRGEMSGLVYCDIYLGCNPITFQKNILWRKTSRTRRSSRSIIARWKYLKKRVTLKQIVTDMFTPWKEAIKLQRAQDKRWAPWLVKTFGFFG